MPFDLSNKIDHKVLRKSENLLYKPINEENFYDIREFQHPRNDNPYRVNIGHIIINSIRSKFKLVVKYVVNTLDILMVSETKIDDTLPESQFFIEGFSTPYRFDQATKWWGIFIYIREDIPSNYIKKIAVNKSFYGFFVELNLRGKKWLLGCSCSPLIEKITSYLSKLSTALDKLCMDYENIILLVDFNVEVEEKKMSEFMIVYNLKNLVKQKTCFKNPENPSCKDLILTNSSRSFQNSNFFETGHSDLQKLTTAILKQYFPKLRPKLVNYRDYRIMMNSEPNLATRY